MEGGVPVGRESMPGGEVKTNEPSDKHFMSGYYNTKNCFMSLLFFKP